MPNEINRIFVSSTWEDLKKYRRAVINSLQTLGSSFYAMEYFCASSKTSKQECLDKVADSNIFIIIIGMRYGSIDPETGKSYTQLEYEKAVETGCNVLAFLIDTEKQPVLPKNMDDGIAKEKLLALKKTITSKHNSSFFTTKDDLAKKVLEALHSTLQTQKFSVNTSPVDSSSMSTHARTSWKDYNGLFHLDRYFAAYIPIINVPKPDFQIMKFSSGDIDIHVDTVPYKLPKEFLSNNSYGKHDGKRCRLSSYNLSREKPKLFISETSYWDYEKSGEHLDEPYKNDPSQTNRDKFGTLLNAASADFTLFNLTNICGCGLFILTKDDKLLITKQSENASVYPGRLTYTASGTMPFGIYPHPFTEILVKTRQEINHQINIHNLRMIGFGADARKLYFQFSFVEEVENTFADLKKQHKGLIPISFQPEPVIEYLVRNIWEPAAEAMLLTLLIEKYEYQPVMDTLVKYKKDWGRHEIKDEWDYRAACGGVAATLSIRYPKDKILDISQQYISEILEFMDMDVKNKDILEVGSGDGRITRHLIDAGARSVTCVDICDRMMKKSKRSLRKKSRNKLIYKNIFAQDYKSHKIHDVAVISLVLIHNVDDSDFQNLVKNVCQYARTVYIFEDVTKDRRVSPYTKLRPEKQLVDEFYKHDFVPMKQQHYFLMNDDIIFIKFNFAKNETDKS